MPTLAVTRPAILTRRDAARFLAVSASLMKKWHRKRVGPRCIKRGGSQTGRAVYRLDTLEAWVEAGCPMEPWEKAAATTSTPEAVAAHPITPRVKAGKTPAKKRPSGSANRPRVHKKPPSEGGIDGAAYPRPQGRQRQRSRTGGTGGKTAERARIAPGKRGLEDSFFRPSTVEARPASGRRATAAGGR
jgi:hypothetical protein